LGLKGFILGQFIGKLGISSTYNLVCRKMASSWVSAPPTYFFNPWRCWCVHGLVCVRMYGYGMTVANYCSQKDAEKLCQMQKRGLVVTLVVICNPSLRCHPSVKCRVSYATNSFSPFLLLSCVSRVLWVKCDR